MKALSDGGTHNLRTTYMKHEPIYIFKPAENVIIYQIIFDIYIII